MELRITLRWLLEKQHVERPWEKNRCKRGFEGEFREGYVHGKAKEELPGEYTYEGEFALGKLNGNGILTLADGSQYKGRFMNN